MISHLCSQDRLKFENIILTHKLTCGPESDIPLESETILKVYLKSCKHRAVDEGLDDVVCLESQG